MDTSDDILQQAKNGNEEIYLLLYKNHRSDFIRWAIQCFFITEEEAKDIFQDVLIAFFENVKSERLIELHCDIRTYLFSIAKYHIINKKKKKQREVTFEGVELINVQTNPFEAMDDKEFNRKVVQDNLQYLPEKDRKLLKMYYEQDLDMKTIAEKLDYKNADVAKKQKYVALKKLAALVKKNLKMFMLV